MSRFTQPGTPENEIDEPALTEAAESIVDGWYAEGRIDWTDFLERLEATADVDLGCDADSPMIRRIKKHVRDYRANPR